MLTLICQTGSIDVQVSFSSAANCYLGSESTPTAACKDAPLFKNVTAAHPASFEVDVSKFSSNAAQFGTACTVYNYAWVFVQAGEDGVLTISSCTNSISNGGQICSRSPTTCDTAIDSCSLSSSSAFAASIFPEECSTSGGTQTFSVPVTAGQVVSLLIGSDFNTGTVSHHVDSFFLLIIAALIFYM